MYCHEKSGFIRLNTEIDQRIADIEALQRRYLEEFGRCPCPSEIANELGLALSRVYELLHYRLLRCPLSIECICETSDVSEDRFVFQEMYSQFSETEIVRSAALAVLIEQAVSKLPPRMQEVIRLYYGLGRESSCTPEEVSNLLGTKRTNVISNAVHGRKRLRVLLAPVVLEKQVAV
jgi:RNA polymerase primary sigma factor